MPPDARVRNARYDDLPHIVPLFCSSLDVVTHSKPSTEYDNSLIKELVTRQCFPSDSSTTVHTYVVEEMSTNSILGYAIVKSIAADGGGGQSSHELHQLVVPTSFRSKRLMGMLMGHLQNLFAEHGLWVRVIKRYEKACRFYRKWHFADVKEMQAQGVDETVPVVIMFWPGDVDRR